MDLGSSATKQAHKETSNLATFEQFGLPLQINLEKL
jgi:hypothetical protein